MIWAEIALQVRADSVEPATALLTESGCAGVVVHDPLARSSDPHAEWIREPGQPEPDRATVTGHHCRVAGYLPFDEQLEAILWEIREGLDTLASLGFDAGTEVDLKSIQDDAWATAWKAYFKPFRVGNRLVVKPSWEAWEEQPGDLILEIDPGMAFGSGTHESTRMCLELIEASVRPGERVLDWGCGSGILSLAALLCGAGSVLAVDLDPVAVETTLQNARAAGREGPIVVRKASIEALPDEETFDRILANIVANPIIAGAGEIALRLRPGGEAVLSGVVREREPEVVSALEQAGLERMTTLHDGEWRAFRFRKPASDSPERSDG